MKQMHGCYCGDMQVLEQLLLALWTLVSLPRPGCTAVPQVAALSMVSDKLTRREHGTFVA